MIQENDNQEIIDVLLTIDADTIVSTYKPGTVDKPTIIDEELIFLIVKQSNGVFGQASKELIITAKTLDTIRWRMTALSFDSAHFGLMYKFFALKGGDLISKPEPLIAEVKVPLPDSSNPKVPKIQTINNYFFTSTVLKKGNVTYAFNFMILDRNNNIQGYYFWDPFIEITD